MAFAGAFLVACGLCFLVWKVTADASRASLQLAHTHSVISALAQIRADTLQVELTTQSFRTSGDERFLAERDRAMVERETSLKALWELVEPFKVQREHWQELRLLIDERMILSRRIEQIRRAEGAQAAAAFVSSAPLRQTRERTYALLGEMESHEDDRLESLVMDQRRIRQMMGSLVLLVAALLGAFLLFTYRFIRKQLLAADVARQALVGSERRLALTLQSIGDALIATDAQGRVIRMNAVAERLCGRRLCTVLGHSLDQVMQLETLDACAAGPLDLRTWQVPRRDTPLILVAPCGRRSIITLTASGIGEEAGNPQGMIFTFHDQTDLYEAKRAVERNNEMLEVTVQERTADIRQAQQTVRALNTELAGRVRELEHVSRALRTLSAGGRAMLRASSELELLEDMCRAIVDAGKYGMAIVWYCEDDSEKTLRPMAEAGYLGGLAALAPLRTTWADNERGRGTAANAIRSGQTSVVSDMQTDVRYRPYRPFLQGNASSLGCPLRVGDRIIGALTIYDAEPDTFDNDEVLLLTESAEELAFGIELMRSRGEESRIRQVVHQLSQFDALTGMPNEAQFVAALLAQIGASEYAPWTVIQFNIDRLSEVNDALGFAQGNLVLKGFARKLESISNGCVVARLRNDEFAMLLPQTGREQAKQRLLLLQEALKEPVSMGELFYDISMHAGIVEVPAGTSSVHEVLRLMNIAVRRARSLGLPFCTFQPSMDANRDQSRRLNMAGDLRRGIERGELSLFVQPKVDMRSGSVCGAEALARWMHPQHGMVSPGVFIPLAEQVGLIKSISEWVIAEGFKIARRWHDCGLALPLALNLSARDLQNPQLSAHIEGQAARHGVPAANVEFELTESAVMEDAERSLHILKEIQLAGFTLYVDDFGTGYSSLSYLQQLPVDYVKIDQSFVRRMISDRDSAAIVRSTIDLVHDLGRKVVAEGVETEAEWNALKAMGCDVAQGYHIARPMPEWEFEHWVSSHASA